MHTADVHLSTVHPRRLEALGKVIQLGLDENIDLLLIAGDLFDDDRQAELLRSSVRGLFSNLPFQVLAIPGNHDQRAFSDESFYGTEFRGLTAKPCTVVDFDGWRLVAVPYGEVSFVSISEDLRRAADPDKKNILVLHCSWSLPYYTNEDYGGEDLRYLPVTEATLTGLGYDYILAGHFHANYRQRILPCGAVFVYPGSPVPVTSREQGRRAVNIIDSKGCRPLPLDSWYYQTLEYVLKVTNTEAVLDQLARELAPHPDEFCTLNVRVKGYTQEKETLLQARLEQLLAGRNNTCLEPLFRGASEIFADPLYQRIRQLLEEGKEKNTELIDIMLLDAFSQLLAEDL
jgi:DNA repair exonuclease SbcCD nuclease subunit